MSLPRISVILPVRNEARTIGRLLDQLLDQTYPANSYEILVADGRSTDATREVAAAGWAAEPRRPHVLPRNGAVASWKAWRFLRLLAT